MANRVTNQGKSSVEQRELTKTEADHLLGQVANDFFDEIAAGGQPDVEHYAQQHPQIAHLIRDTFSVVDLLDGTPEVAGEAAAKATVKRTLGDFRIGPELGRGGMGVVYEAEQISMGRTVALKVLPFAAVMDDKAITRFKNEARAAGTLHHENIVPVHAVGNERGVYYYAMALIQGLTVAEIIQELRQQVVSGAAPDRREFLLDQVVSDRSDAVVHVEQRVSSRLEPTIDSGTSNRNHSDCHDPETERVLQDAMSTHRSLFGSRFYRQIARIGRETAEALHHAHEHGIVHRDIKPGNLIVDPTGKVWVTDFGLARIETDAGMTMTGDLLGTLRYMAPEQALAKRIVVDHRADIYSLGVTLYELLALRPVFDGATREELLKQLTFEEPKRLRQIHSTIPADLETIVAKAISKNPDERYSTAAELAADLKAFQQNQPIKAKPPSWAQRGRRWASRHQATVAAAALILLVSTVALAISTLVISNQQDATNAALRQATENLEEANRQQKRAEENFRRAREVVDTYLTKVGESELQNAPGLQELQHELLELALEHYEGFVQEYGDDPHLQEELAAALDRVGNIRFTLDLDGESPISFHQRALDIRKRLVAENPQDPKLQNGLAESYRRVWTTDSHQQAFDRLTKAIEITRPLGDPENRLTLARALTNLGFRKVSFFVDQGGMKHIHDAHDALVEAVEVLEELAEKERTTQLVLNLAEAYQALAYWHSTMGSEQQENTYLQKSLAASQECAAKNPENQRIKNVLLYAYWDAGEHDKAIEIANGLAAENPRVLSYQTQLARLYRALSSIRKPKKEAAEWARKGIEVWDRLLQKQPDHERFRCERAVQQQYLAKCLSASGQLEEAVSNCNAAIATLTEVGAWPGQLCDTYSLLSAVLERSGRLEQAIQAKRNQIQVQPRLSGDNLRYRTISADTYRELGDLLRQAGRIDEAIVEYETAVELLQKEFASGNKPEGTPDQVRLAHSLLTNASNSLLACLKALGQFQRAAEVAHAAIVVERQVFRTIPEHELDVFRIHQFYLEHKANIGNSTASGSLDAFLRSELSEWNALGDRNSETAARIQRMESMVRLAVHSQVGQRIGEADAWFEKATACLSELISEGDNEAHNALVGVLWCWRPGSEADASEAELSFRSLVLDNLERALEVSRQRMTGKPARGWDDWNRLAMAYYRQRDWQGAEHDARLAIELGSDRPNNVISVAPMLVLAGRREEYHSLCRQIVERRDGWVDLQLGGAMNLCSLDPTPVEGSQVLYELVSRGLKEGPDWVWGAAARVYARIGRHDEALRLIEENDPNLDLDPVLKQLSDSVILALLGQDDRARMLLEEAWPRMRGWNNKWSGPRMEFELLLREAEQLGITPR